MTPEALARLHAVCFHTPRPWTAGEFTDLLTDPLNFIIVRDHGFILCRTIFEEAELLTLAVAPHARRRGIGGVLLTEFESEAIRRRATSAFLEVASDNISAINLYGQKNWKKIGQRRNYYAPGIDALVMRKELPAP